MCGHCVVLNNSDATINFRNQSHVTEFITSCDHVYVRLCLLYRKLLSLSEVPVDVYNSSMFYEL